MLAGQKKTVETTAAHSHLSVTRACIAMETRNVCQGHWSSIAMVTAVTASGTRDVIRMVTSAMTMAIVTNTIAMTMELVTGTLSVMALEVN